MIAPPLERLRQEWRDSQRLRIAALCGAVVLGMHLAFGLSDRQVEDRTQYVRDADLLARLKDASRDLAWPERADKAEAALLAMRQSIPSVGSSGLAQAELQTWLSQQAQVAGLQEPNVRVETTLDVPSHPDMWLVMARLDAAAPVGTLSAFLRGLSTGLPWIQAERVEVADGQTARVSVVVRAYYRRTDASDGVLGTPAGRADAASADPSSPSVAVPLPAAPAAAPGQGAQPGAPARYFQDPPGTAPPTGEAR